MKLMYKEGGFNYFNDGAVEQAVKDGWGDGEFHHKAMIEAKFHPIAKYEEVDTIEHATPQDTKRRPGRPPKIAEEI